jgi:hypothetical protein
MRRATILVHQCPDCKHGAGDSRSIVVSSHNEALALAYIYLVSPVIPASLLSAFIGEKLPATTNEIRAEGPIEALFSEQEAVPLQRENPLGPERLGTERRLDRLSKDR